MQTSSAPVIAIAAGHSHSVALTKAGEVLTWGANDQGQLGDASAEDRFLPQKVFQEAPHGAEPCCPFGL